MNLLVITDVHGRVDLIKRIPEVSDADLIVFAGDVTPYGLGLDPYKVLAKLTKFIEPKVLIAVPGNMDPASIYDRAERELGIKLVHGRAFKVGDVAFIGVGGSPPTPFGTLTEFPEDTIEEVLAEALKEAEGCGRLVLVSHAPPYGTRCDVAVGGRHVGSIKVREFILRHQPVLSICGHIHESRAVDELGKTKVVNPGPFFRGYYAVAKLTKEGAEVELKKI